MANAWPDHWTRIEVPVPQEYYHGSEIVDKWIEKNLYGRWGMIERTQRRGENLLIICFEFENDALMFKLLGGHEAWEEDED